MISGCEIFGIYPDAINRAYEIAMNQLDKFGIPSNYFDTDMQEELEESIDPNNISNSLIFVIFRTLENYLEDNGFDEDRIDFYVNGFDSHFYIDKEEVK